MKRPTLTRYTKPVKCESRVVMELNHQKFGRLLPLSHSQKLPADSNPTKLLKENPIVIFLPYNLPLTGSDKNMAQYLLFLM